MTTTPDTSRATACTVCGADPVAAERAGGALARVAAELPWAPVRVNGVMTCGALACIHATLERQARRAAGLGAAGRDDGGAP